MEIYINTDHNLAGRERVTRHAEAAVAAGMSRFTDQITRVDVHLGDESSGRKTVDDKRCALEACPTGQPPVAVTHHADTPEAALTGAIRKLQHLLDSKFDRPNARNGRGSIRGHATP